MYYGIFFLTLIIVCGILYLANRYSVKMICGDSMLPTFKDGEIVILKKKDYSFYPGNVYAFYDPDGTPCIKRLYKLSSNKANGDIYLFFIGDNLDKSCDSRDFGFIHPSKVIGEVIKLRGK